MIQVNRLKEEKVRLESELKSAKRAAVTSTASVTQRELTMAAFDQVLTGGILSYCMVNVGIAYI